MSWFIVTLAATKLIPTAIGIRYFKRLSLPLKIFTVLVASSSLNELLLFLLASSGRHNLFQIHIDSIIEVSLLAAFFYYGLRDPARKRNILMMAVFTVAFSIIYALIGDNFYMYPSIPRALDALLVSCGCMFLFYEIATTGDSYDPLNYGTYFINGGILLYFSATFVTWLLMKYVIDQKTIVSALYGSHAYINAFCNLVFGYGLWITSRSSLQYS